MKPTTPPRSGPSGQGAAIVAGVEHHSGAWFAAVVSGGPEGPTLIASRREASPEAMGAALRALKVQRVVRVAPMGQSLARCVEVQAGEAEAMEAALGLLAEGELPESIPPHRRAAGLLVASDGSAATALVTAWTGDAEHSAPLCSGVQESWTSSPAALSALLGGRPGMALLGDRATGSIALIARGSRRWLSRTLLEEHTDAASWAEGVRIAASEAGTACGCAPAHVNGREQRIWVPAESAQWAARIAGSAANEAWLEEFGVALGAAIIGSSPAATVQRLASMHPTPPRQPTNIAQKIGDVLRSPRRAWVIAGVCVVLTFAAPLAFAWARTAILRSKSEAIKAQEESARELAARAALYEQLHQVRWPMTKLMADVAGATPVGIVVDSLRLAPDSGLAVEGSAESVELVSQLQENLNATGIFQQVRIDRAEMTTGESVSFVLSGSVVNPTMPAKPAEDFAAKPLAVRLYGEGASNLAATAPAERSGPSRRGSSSERSGDRSSGERSGETVIRSSPERPSGTSEAIPAALTDEAIGAMDRTTAMREWASRSSYVRRNASLDGDTKSRLEREVTKLRERMDATKGGG